MEDKRIEGAQSVLPPADLPQETSARHTETTTKITQHQTADEILSAEAHYGDPGEENELNVTKGNDQEDSDYDVVVEQTYYEPGKEELDYDDDLPAGEEDIVVRDAYDDGKSYDEDEDELADDNDAKDINDEDEAAKSTHLKKGKDAPVWGWLATPVGDRSATDTETGEKSLE